MSFYSEKERVQLQPAYILHQIPYRNTSLILDILSKDHGRLSLIAKGAKQAKSKFRGCLQPFQQLSISWVRKSDLGTLTQAEIIAKPSMLSGEIMFSALYLNELLLRVLEKGDHSPSYFEYYAQALNELEAVSIDHNSLDKGINNVTEVCNEVPNVAPILRVFEYHLLQSLGFEIQLDYDVEQNEIEAACFYKFIPEHGLVKSSEKHVFLFKGEHLLLFKNNKFNSPDALKTAQRIMQTGLRRVIGDKPLKSRELYKAFRQMQK